MRITLHYLFGAIALILWYALFTYDAADPSFSHATTDETVRNGVGRVGAYTAGLLFDLFGRPAYLFTVMVFFLGWMLYREQKTQIELTGLDFALRVSGFVATLFTSCALSALHFSSVGFNNSAGGIVGKVTKVLEGEEVMVELAEKVVVPSTLASALVHPEETSFNLPRYAFGWFVHPKSGFIFHFDLPCVYAVTDPTCNIYAHPELMKIKKEKKYEPSPMPESGKRIDPEEDIAATFGLYLTSARSRELLRIKYPRRYKLIKWYFDYLKQ